ncbi:MAG: hypothetical protein ACR2GQ_01535 [Gemmatimonadota bacterium]
MSDGLDGTGGLDERTRIRRVPVADRPDKVGSGDFAGPPVAGGSFSEFVESLPHILQADAFRAVARAVAGAAGRRTCLWMLGGHVVKTGLSRVLIELMERGAITHVAVNGSTVIHDYETCRWGGTSEDVEAGLADGTFGMAEETGRDMNVAIVEGARAGRGLGEALGDDLAARDDNRYPELSLILATRRLGIGLTVHAAIGAEIIHQHPEADGGAIGSTSYRDFMTLSRAIEGLDDGGVVLNVGSAVLLPEVFLKALTVRRNLAGGRPGNFVAADFDMIRHYRPRVNVVERPVRTGGGAGYQITGHHEIMVPMLAWSIVDLLEARSVGSDPP